MNRSTIFLRGAGGFSDSSRPYSYTTYPANQISRISIPNSAPSAVYEDQTQQSQALLYRLSGDYNPLHSDPMVAQVAGVHPSNTARPLHSGVRGPGGHQVVLQRGSSGGAEHLRPVPAARLPRRDAGHRDVGRRPEGAVPDQGEGA
uniref:MaoC-like domain-containing protein n=1 Tax=Aegilops tauschii subsp. strangulata TaxID=200361 RepID=A0A453LIE1_AEGTS